MRVLVLAGILAMALPALGADEPAPAVKSATGDSTAVESTTLDGVAASAEPAAGAPADVVEEEVVEAEPARPPVPPEALARGTFATAIDQREPVDAITSLESDRDRVYYFNEFVGIGGRRLTHRWEYQGEVMAEVPIEIGGPRWRAYSSKNLLAGQLGEWTVSVVDEAGNVLRKDSFVYEAAAPEPEIAATATTPPAQAATGDAPDAAPEEAPASPAPDQP